MIARETAQEDLHTLEQSLQDGARYKQSYKKVDLERDRDIQNMVLHA